MKDEFKLTANEDKAAGIVTLFRGKYPVLCPFRSPILVPVPAAPLTIGSKGPGLDMVNQQCNSLCPHFKITPGYINEHGLFLNDTASVEFKCTPTPGDKMPIL